jgi:hypothetical protein
MLNSVPTSINLLFLVLHNQARLSGAVRFTDIPHMSLQFGLAPDDSGGFRGQLARPSGAFGAK